MNLDASLQNLIFGLFVGSNYGVAAAGLSLVFGVLRVLNVAHGELLMLGGSPRQVPAEVLQEHQKRLSDWQAKLTHLQKALDGLGGN